MSYAKPGDDDFDEYGEFFEGHSKQPKLVVGFDPATDKPVFGKRVWTTRDGKTIEISKMGSDHLRYAIRSLEEGAILKRGPGAKPQGDKYVWLLQELAGRGLTKLPLRVDKIARIDDTVEESADRALFEIEQTLEALGK